MKNRYLALAAALIIAIPDASMAEDCEPSRWTVTLAQLEPLTEDQRQFILDTLGIEMGLEMLDQTIAEGQVDLEAFGGE